MRKPRPGCGNRSSEAETASRTRKSLILLWKIRFTSLLQSNLSYTMQFAKLVIVINKQDIINNANRFMGNWAKLIRQNKSAIAWCFRNARRLHVC